MMKQTRASGILLHITSLPGPYGIGDFGSEAYKFADFLHSTSQTIWQILPLTPTEKCSPYSGMSAFAGHPLLISLDRLVDMQLLSKDDLKIPSSFQFSDQYVKFKQVTQYKIAMLKKAYQNYKVQNNHGKDGLQKFIQAEKEWLDDYALYMTIREEQNYKSWSQWPDELKHRRKEAMDRVRQGHKDAYDYYVFLQYIFDLQWSELKAYTNKLNIKIWGDMPVYVDYDSADVWSNPDVFQLDSKTLLPSAVSGFPPDDCSVEGQNWNTPLYQWNDESKRPGVFQWWVKRLRKTLQVVDVVRIDHFRGLESYWSIPVDKNFVPLKPVEGEWKKTPGVEFFTTIFNALGADLPLIVEDLGGLNKDVFDLRDRFNLTGIRILQFGFGYFPDNIYRPHNYIPNCVAYTATHDNPTILGWWKDNASKDEKKTFVEYMKTPFIKDDKDEQALLENIEKNVHWYFIQIVLASVANNAVIQLQDLMGLDNSGQMNAPSKGSDPESDAQQNWTWRFTWSMIPESAKKKLESFTHMYNRAPVAENE